MPARHVNARHVISLIAIICTYSDGAHGHTEIRQYILPPNHPSKKPHGPPADRPAVELAGAFGLVDYLHETYFDQEAF